jgi:hypothetical protein
VTVGLGWHVPFGSTQEGHHGLHPLRPPQPARRDLHDPPHQFWPADRPRPARSEPDTDAGTALHQAVFVLQTLCMGQTKAEIPNPKEEEETATVRTQAARHCLPRRLMPVRHLRLPGRLSALPGRVHPARWVLHRRRVRRGQDVPAGGVRLPGQDRPLRRAVLPASRLALPFRATHYRNDPFRVMAKQRPPPRVVAAVSP